MSMKIHAWIARQLPISRREAEKRVGDGFVSVDGEVAKIGQLISGDEKITMNGKIIEASEYQRRLLVMNKKVGWVCSMAEQNGQDSVFNYLPKLRKGKWMLVGRLDLNTSGLLLVTNDGYLSNCLAHPSSGFEREYLVRVSKEITPVMRKELLMGIELDDGVAAFKSIKAHRDGSKLGTNRWYSVTLTEGRNRIVRRLMASKGMLVSRLVRLKFGPFTLDKRLKLGAFEEVDSEWVDRLIKKQGW